LALSFALVNNIKANRSQHFDYRLFWKNSLVGATAATLLAEKLEPSLADDAFFLGLLQNMGILVLGHCLPKQYDLVIKELEKKDISYHQAENQILGFDHQQIGAYLTQAWELPEIFYLPISCHHNPENLPPDQSPMKKMTTILYLSSLYIELFDSNSKGMNLWLIEDTVKKSNFENEIDIDGIGVEISRQTQNIFPIFDIEVDKDEYISLLESARQELAKLSIEMINNFREQNREIDILKQQVSLDGMTQLYNHQYFRKVLQREVYRATRYKMPLSLILADIDNFKSINDTYGHPTGDIVIKTVADCLKSKLRESDCVARYGGEEFAIVAVETSLQNAELVAERLRSEIEALRISYEQNTIDVTMSFGVACFPADGEIAMDEFIKHADHALYRAKKDGRNRCCTYNLS
jgi:diguanylate cyclase (GGDEF)-like protein